MTINGACSVDLRTIPSDDDGKKGALVGCSSLVFHVWATSKSIIDKGHCGLHRENVGCECLFIPHRVIWLTGDWAIPWHMKGRCRWKVGGGGYSTIQNQQHMHSGFHSLDSIIQSRRSSRHHR